MLSSLSLFSLGQTSVSPVASTCAAVRSLFRENTCCAGSTATIGDLSSVCPGTDVEVTYAANFGVWTPCPVEEVYANFSADNPVAPGYSGCIAEASPGVCGWYDYYDYDASTNTCSQTATLSTAIQTIRGGSPTMTADMLRLTGEDLNPTITLPALPMSYPPGRDNSAPEIAELEVTWNRFMIYFGSQLDLTDFDGYPTYGAEMGMVAMIGIKVLELAATTCTRDFHAMLEAPAYGYDWSQAIEWAESRRSSFYAGEECPCYATGTCNDRGVLTITQRGWAPENPIQPTAVGADGMTYSPTSTEPNSPWFQTNVIPGNPIGRFRECVVPSDRCLCDGVYWFPGFLSPGTAMTNFQCYAWAMSITKIYSAQMRAGMMFVRQSAASYASGVMRRALSIANGLMSTMQIRGQIQIMNKIMVKPFSDPTSWLHAMALAQYEKWDVMDAAFATCEAAGIVRRTAEQPLYHGAYIFGYLMPEFHGLSTNIGSSSNDFFMSVVGYNHFNYAWGWRGEAPGNYGVGANITVQDFVRIHTFRARAAYVEEARRMNLICGDRNARVTSALFSVNEWISLRTADSRRRRRLDEAKPTLHERALEVQSAVPRMSLVDAIKHSMNTDKDKEIKWEYGLPHDLDELKGI